jgi:UPF0755 protein
VAGRAGPAVVTVVTGVVVVTPDDLPPEGTGQGSGEAVPFDQHAADAGADQHAEDADLEPGSPDDDELVPGRPGRTRGRRRLSTGWRVALAVVGLVVLFVLACGAWYEFQAHPGGPPGRQVVLTVKSGEASDSVVTQLSNTGVVTSDLAYRVYLFFHGTPTVRPGGYLLRQDMSFASVSQKLAAGPDVFPVTMPAGFTVKEAAARIGDLPDRDAQAVLQAADSGAVKSPWEAPGSHNLEGLLAPGTYVVRPDESDTALLQQMVDRFDQEAAKLDVTPATATALGVTPNQLVTVASIVEKEGYLPRNMPKVSRVIYNRLAAGMPLQMDSTVLYSLGQDGGTVTPADERIPSPYNTYLNVGLPPTPIAIPSPAALRAAGHPPPGPWLYFVVVNKSGTEAFSTTYAQQLKNEALAQKRGV